MEKEFAKYMKWGKQVRGSDGKTYKLVENMDENKDLVKVVNMGDLSRYDLLSAWISNWEQNCFGFREKFPKDNEDWKVERLSYEIELRIADIEPNNEIRFITSDYKDLFKVKDLTTVFVDGTEARVSYIDECHFTFIDKINMRLYGGAFHICQFAEVCERCGIEVKQVKEIKGFN